MTNRLSDIVNNLDLVVLRPNSGWIVIQVSFLDLSFSRFLQYPEFLASWVSGLWEVLAREVGFLFLDQLPILIS